MIKVGNNMAGAAQYRHNQPKAQAKGEFQIHGVALSVTCVWHALAIWNRPHSSMITANHWIEVCSDF